MLPDVALPGSMTAEERIARWTAEPEERGAELLHGRIVYKAMPDPRHGVAQGGLTSGLHNPFNRELGEKDYPGGWWLSLEVDMILDGHGVRPDVCGWRRERCPRLPVPGPKGVVTEVPDWIAEVLSPSTAGRDLGEKRDIYFQAGVAWYWILDPVAKSIAVLRRIDEGYLFAAYATAPERLRAEPFDVVELELARIFPYE